MSKPTVNVNIADFICQNESMVQFDKDIISVDFTNVKTDVTLQQNYFGVINLKIKKMVPSIQKRHFVFTVDCSGSMSDKCNDGRTKMDHANHTLINMMNYYAEHPELMVSITVFAFDGSIYKIITNEEVREDNLDKLIQHIKKIRPKDMTNIEQALISSREYIANYINNNRDVYVSHIFMTDGDATQGETNPFKLKEYISPLVSNNFIGFGIEHNTYLLKEFATDIKNNYYFVDALEKAGLVYGEILHSIIYRVLENTNISVVNGLIYDWKTNSWVDQLDIGDLISETNKTYHILTDNPNEFDCIFQTTHCVSKEIFDFTIQNTIKKVDIIDDGFVDLIQYKYRQRTQQLLFEVNEYNFNKVNNDDDHLRFNTSYYNYNVTHENVDTDELHNTDTVNSIKLKEKMKSLLKDMQQFLDNLDNTTLTASAVSSFIKLLCDDLYICLKTFDTKHSAMFSCARQLSQGAQRAYSATCTPKAPRNDHVFDVGNFGTPIIKRSIAGNYNDNDNDNDNENNSFISKFPDFNDDELNNDNFNKEFYQVINDDQSYDNDTEYNLSSEVDNPYSTLSILDLMRSCSNSNVK
jgi:hypothetical protein